MLPDSRVCTKCGLDKPLSEFSKASRGKYGRKANCKACDSARWYANPKSQALPPGEVKRRLEERRGDTKKCNGCGEIKPRTEFHKASDGVHGPILQTICKICHAARVREWYSRTGGQSDTNDRRLNLKQLYGITLDEYDAMLAAQGGVCAICKREERSKRDGKIMRMPVDHCHTTGRVRGILCHACNRAIGLLGEDADVIRKVIKYLLEHREPGVSDLSPGASPDMR